MSAQQVVAFSWHLSSLVVLCHHSGNLEVYRTLENNSLRYLQLGDHAFAVNWVALVFHDRSSELILSDQVFLVHSPWSSSPLADYRNHRIGHKLDHPSSHNKNYRLGHCLENHLTPWELQDRNLVKTSQYGWNLWVSKVIWHFYLTLGILPF